MPSRSQKPGDINAARRIDVPDRLGGEHRVLEGIKHEIAGFGAPAFYHDADASQVTLAL